MELDKNLPIILIINKIDRSDARIEEVVNEVYDLFIDLDANEDQIEFPIIYTNAKERVSHSAIGDNSKDLTPLFDLIIEKFPGPLAIDNHVTQSKIINSNSTVYLIG